MSKIVHKIEDIKKAVSLQAWSECVYVTPKIAKEMRENYNFPRQRNIKKGNVERLVNEMKNSRFITGTQIFICVLPGGERYIVNGNHTLEAIIASEFSQLLTLTYHTTSTFEEVCHIYSVFDLQSRRSAGDSIRAYGLDDLPNSKKIYAAMPVIKTAFRLDHRGVHSRPDMLALMEQYLNEAAQFSDVIKGAEAKLLLTRAGIVAVALETFKAQPSQAAEFWSSVARDDGLTVGSPEKALLKWLRGSRLAGKLGQTEHIRAAACAWNAHWRGVDIEHVKPNQMRSFYLLGTRWERGSGEA